MVNCIRIRTGIVIKVFTRILSGVQRRKNGRGQNNTVCSETSTLKLFSASICSIRGAQISMPTSMGGLVGTGIGAGMAVLVETLVVVAVTVMGGF
jgi:hypothetical protein